MKTFPGVTIPDLSVFNRIFSILTDEYRLYKDIRQELSDIRKNAISNALSVLQYLGIVEATGRGRGRKYRRRVNEINLLINYLNAWDVYETLGLIFAGVRKRADLATRVYEKVNKTKSSKLKSISAIASMGKRLGLLSISRFYALTKEGKSLVFQFYLEKMYDEERNKVGISAILIPKIKSKMCEKLNLKPEQFNKMLLELTNDRKDIILTPAPAVTEEMKQQGIPTDKGVLYHIRINEFKTYRG